MKISLSGYSAELFKASELSIDEKISNVSELKKYLISRKSELSNHHTAVAINSILAKDSDALKLDDDILIFHPYSGG